MTAYTGRPLYLRIADDLRSDILSNRLRPGDKLPSEADLIKRYTVSRIVARMSLGVLRQDGLIDSHQGKGSFVRERKPTRRLTGERYKRLPDGATPFTSDIKTAGGQPDWQWNSYVSKPTAHVAERLGIDVAEDVMVTEYRFLADSQPVQLSTSYEPLALTAGTPIEEPEVGPVRGVVNRFDSIGIRVTHVTEDVRGRPPHPFECEALVIPTAVHVFEINRTHHVGDTAVEACDIVVPEDRYALSYRIDLA